MKKFMAILLTFALTLSFSACSTGSSSSPDAGESSGQSAASAQSDKPLIGHLSISLGSDFTTSIDNGIRRAADEKGYEVMTIDVNNDPELELTGVETMLSSGVKAFYTISVSSENVWNAVQEKDSSVGVISQQPAAPATTHVVEDNEGMAQMFLESLNAYMEEAGIESAKVACLWLAECESPEMSMYTGRQTILESLNAAFEGTDNEIICELFTSDPEVTANNAESVLNMYPECNVFFCYSSAGAISASNTVISSGSDIDQYYIFSSESEEETYRQIADPSSPLRGCASGSVENLGYNIGLQLINYAETGSMEDVPVPKELCDWRNINDFI